MGLLDWFQSRWQRQSKTYKYVHIAPGNIVTASGGAAAEEPFAAGDHYFRLWLVEMFLANDREWFTSWHPAVHAAIKFQFGDRNELITRVAGSSLLADLSTENLDRVVGMNYPMTPLMPFNGGSIELSAGLLAIAGKNDVKGFLKVLGDFSNLLMVPQLSTALSLATPLANGLSEMVGATENQLMLGLHQTWTAGSGGAAPLRAGYFTVILADDSELDDDHLWVQDGRLKYGKSLTTAQPLRGYNYMLFRLERRDERDDWDSLMTIQEPYNKAIEMLRVGNTDQGEAYIRAAKAAAFLANELTRNVDQRRVVLQIQKRYDEAKENMGLGAFPEPDASFNDVMLGAMSIAEAKALGSLLPENVGLEGLSVPEVREAERAANAQQGGSEAEAGGKASESLKSKKLDGKLISEKKRSAPTEQFYFALEGDSVKGDAVQFGTNVDLVFNYAVVEREVLTLLQGQELQRARNTNADLGIAVIPRGFSFREEDPEWFKVARFRGGRLESPVRFLLRARDQRVAESRPGVQIGDEDSLPILQTGFQITFEMKGITLYDFPLPIRLVRSIADYDFPLPIMLGRSIAEVDELTEVRAPLILNLDKSAKRAQKALKILEDATGPLIMVSALRSVFEPKIQLGNISEGEWS